ncbi:hypothetical protein EGM88_04740 [Aureibaculum marinum]|uniref:Signal transduction histidine kinase internal region domain-containing protein n=1 Tax=Aureibaculum marinum TaxID=2487930 RepID=A0A3N4NQ74_9FLAO|nr:histidine kinase [Aureibaculum marinum]RPD98512.1 hypothetical protein EGM88_04740 [Aureibaculum marinum]
MSTGDQSGICFLKDDEENIIWYGGRKGLYKINLNTLTSTKIFLEEPLFHANWRNFIIQLEHEKDTLYVGTANGIYLLDKHSNKLLAKYLTNGYDFGHRESSNAVQSIYPTIEIDAFWVVMYSGLYRITKKEGIIEKFTLDEAPYILPHNFFKGHLFGDNNLLLPSWGLGLVKFNLDTKKFTHFVTQPNKKWLREDNIMRSVISLNDSISLTNVAIYGNSLFNRNTNMYNWLETPKSMKEGVYLNVDRSGYIWSSKRGRIFRTISPVIETALPVKHIIDVSSFRVNDELKSRPNLEGYSLINLEEAERNIHLEFSISRPYVLDSINYQYRIDSNDWITVTTPNHLKIYGLSSGKHQISIRALNHKNDTLAERNLAFIINLPFYKSPIFIGACFFSLLGTMYLLGRFKNNQKIKAERIKSNYELKVSKLESEALRSQINPHFIFNTLNSIKFYTLKKSKEETMDFISKFSILIRQILENSRQNLIPIEAELETIRSYLEIEKLRFDKSFDFTIVIANNVNLSFSIPPMIIQPFVENAIWHGLMHKNGERNLSVRFTQINATIICEVEDNGIGRIAAQEISKRKPHKSSLGMEITTERLTQLEMVYNIKCTFDVIDLYSHNNKAKGTKAIIRFKNLN